MYSHEFHPDLDLCIEPGQDLFCNHRVRHCVPSVDGTHALEMIGFGVGVGCLEGLLGKVETGALLGALEIEAPPAVSIRTIPKSINSILHSALSNSLAGGLRHTHALAKGIDYLSALYQHSVDLCPTNQQERKLEEAVGALHDQLLTMDGKLPNLDTLAEQFGYPSRTLNLAFTKRYGASIFSFISGHRLKQARAAILTMDVPLKALAMSLGFSHVNHFNIAFKRYFHVSPGSLRPKKGGG